MKSLNNSMPNPSLLSYQPMPFYDDLGDQTFNFDKKSMVRYKLDLNLYCIKRPEQTCFIRINNPNLLAWGIEQGDILVVEKNEQLNVGDFVVMEEQDQLQIYEFFAHQQQEFIFFPLDTKGKTLKVQSWQALPIVGTVTNTIHQFKPKNNLVKNSLELAA